MPNQDSGARKALHTPQVQGWCPGAWQPMVSGDGLVVRVRPPMGRLTLHQAWRLARLARTHGAGILELSSRANVQVRGVDPARHVAVLRALAGCGLLDADMQRERLRNVVVDPLHQPGDGVQALATALLLGLEEADDLGALPAKFGWAIDGGHSPWLQTVSADIRMQRVPGAHPLPGGFSLMACPGPWPQRAPWMPPLRGSRWRGGLPRIASGSAQPGSGRGAWRHMPANWSACWLSPHRQPPGHRACPQAWAGSRPPPATTQTQTGPARRPACCPVSAPWWGPLWAGCRHRHWPGWWGPCVVMRPGCG